MKYFCFCLIIVPTLILSSCKDSPTAYENLNTPVITNVSNSFTYSVHASVFSNNAGGTLSFTSDSLIITLSSSEYVSGRAIVFVRDTLNAVVFSDTVQSNKTIAIAGLKTTRPKYYSVNAANLTGKLVFVLVGQ